MAQGSVVRFSGKSFDLKVLPIQLSTTRRPIGIITLANRTLSPVAQLFVKAAHEVAKGLRS
jgi:LysR family pca operon transcriptional activator